MAPAGVIQQEMAPEGPSARAAAVSKALQNLRSGEVEAGTVDGVP